MASEGVGNPSGRRDGITIEFECEQCEGVLELNIAQHKGETLMEWVAEEAQLEEKNDDYSPF